MPTPDTMAEAAEALRAARRVTVFTGAGISAESQIPTFRDQGGIWDRFPVERFATWEGLLRTAAIRPRELAEFVREVLGSIGRAEPNPGHLAIAALEQHCSARVVTQNVDGLHQAAGSTIVREIHGSMLQTATLGGRVVRSLARDELARMSDDLGAAARSRLALPRLLAIIRPLFGLTGAGFVRPNLVLFGGELQEPDWFEARNDARRCDLFLIVGTSGTVMPAAALPGQALAHGAVTIAVDPEGGLPAHVVLSGRAGEVLPQLVAMAFES